LIARFGGEEFLVVFFRMSDREVDEAVERLRTSIQDRAETSDGKARTVTASFGLSAPNGRSDVTVKQLLQEADHALYLAKAGGRNCFRRFAIEEPSLNKLPDFSNSLYKQPL